MSRLDKLAHAITAPEADLPLGGQGRRILCLTMSSGICSVPSHILRIRDVDALPIITAICQH